MGHDEAAGSTAGPTEATPTGGCQRHGE
jgi:hypothetical protein